MLNSYTKDILRTIKNNGKRFIALMLITALGLTAFAGIYAACRDYYISADRFYDEQHLFDVRVLSTLGLTEDDVDALQSLPSVEKSDGSFRKMVRTPINNVPQPAETIMISPKGINAPYVLEGIMPRTAGEIAVNKKYLTHSGKKIGDTLTLEETFDDSDDDDDEDKPSLRRTKFTITAMVIDPMFIANAEGTAGFRFAAAAEYTFFVLPSDYDTDIYTSVYLTLKNVSSLECYSPEYTVAVADAIDEINKHIKAQREQARYDDIVNEATDKITDAETEMNDKFADADTEIADAKKEIEDAEKELADGTTTLTKEEKEAWQKIEDARKELSDAKVKLENSQNDLDAGLAELNANIVKANAGQTELDKKRAEAEAGFASAQSQLEDGQAKINAGQIQIDAGQAKLNEEQAKLDAQAHLMPPEMLAAYQAELDKEKAKFEQEKTTFEQGKADLEKQKAAFETQKAATEEQLADAKKELDDGFVQMEKAEAEIHDGQRQVNEGWAEYNNGIKKLGEEEAKAKKEIADAKKKLDDGKKELAEGQEELHENETEYHKERADAEAELADAYAKLDDIDMTKWYVQDRNSMDSYVGLDTDLQSINVIGRAFPVLFLIVAILISLTTMTRMVEEERGLIGIYKALGYNNVSIGAKYIIYALAASVFGSLLGYITGFIVLPKVLFVVLDVIYVIPNTKLHFDFIYGSVGALMFIVSILIATVIVCRKEVRRVPASLMRPKAPKMGARIFLERITPIWKRLKFINKITARNIFRYKKRLIMTVFGIACCTALVLTGFAIRDSVIDLMPKQYDDIDQYEILAYANPEEEDKLFEHLSNDTEITDYIAIQAYSVKLISKDNSSTNITLIVVPNNSNFDNYMNLRDLNGNPVVFNDNGVFITQNAVELLGLSVGDDIILQTLQLDQYDTNLQGVVENYLGNNIYITETLFTSLFEDFKPNVAYAHFAGDANAEKAYSDDLDKQDYVAFAMSAESNKERFSSDFAILNFVIYILIVLAASLAFVVLFTLASTNISERMRELATIKVLGFYDREVYSYVNKETLLLTFISVLLGLPLGYLLSGLLLGSLKMPEIQFVLIIRPQSYLFAGLISFSFTLIVNLITNRMLNKINMVEALKSVE